VAIMTMEKQRCLVDLLIIVGLLQLLGDRFPLTSLLYQRKIVRSHHRH
jgi:hypothetical protein